MTVCSTCDDTHQMLLHESHSIVPCTKCPVPCETCRGRGGSAYCATTPCSCPCHERQRARIRAHLATVSNTGHDGTLPSILRQVMRMLGDIGCSHVTIERTIPRNDGDGTRAHPLQIRFEPPSVHPRIYARHMAPSESWFPWESQIGGGQFTLDDVLATDWRFVP